MTYVVWLSLLEILTLRHWILEGDMCEMTFTSRDMDVETFNPWWHLWSCCHFEIIAVKTLNPWWWRMWSDCHFSRYWRWDVESLMMTSVVWLLLLEILTLRHWILAGDMCELTVTSRDMDVETLNPWWHFVVWLPLLETFCGLNITSRDIDVETFNP